MEETQEQTEVVDTNLEGTEQVEEVQLEANPFEIFNTKLGANIDYSNYADDYDGVANFMKDYANMQKNSYEQSLQQAAPEIYQVLSIALQGGNYQEVLRQIANNSSGLEAFDNSDINTMRNIVFNEMKKSGFLTDDEIKAKIDKAQDEGKLESFAKSIVDRDTEKARLANEQAIKAEQARIEYAKQQAGKKANEIRKIVEEKGKVQDIDLPLAERSKFLDFINENVQYDDNGELYYAYKIDSEEDLANLFFRYRKGNISDLVKIKAMTANATKFSEKLQGKQIKQAEPKTKEELEREAIEKSVQAMRQQIYGK